MPVPVRRRAPTVAVLTATAVDLGLLVGLRAVTGWPVAAADVIALAAAAPVSFGLHRWAERTADPFVRWTTDPASFARIAVVAGLVDLAVLQILVVVADDPGLPALAGLKAAAIAVAGLVRLAGYRRDRLRVVRAEQAERTERPPARGGLRFSVVLPAYDQAAFIGETVDTVRRVLEPVVGADQLELIVVDDGSSDDTAERARAAGADTVVVHDHNRGKGAAVRTGVEAAHGRTVAFTDADLAYAPDHLLDVLTAVEEGWDVVVGSRRHTDTVTLVRAGRLREVGGRVINLLTQAVLLGQYRDTQCGLKGFRSDTARLVLGGGQLDGFAFDIEIFHLVERYGLSLKELPVHVANSDRSSVRVVRDGARLVADLFRLRRYAAEGRYA
jgi:dolichyl-phosphate beta-glucosyltransferase